MADGDGAPAVAHKIVAYPQPFEDGDVEDWIVHFNQCARANHWNADMKARAAPAYLRGRAALIYRDFGDTETDTWDHLSAALTRAFAPDTAERRRIARQYLFSHGETLRWDPSQPLQKYVRRITKLVEKGFPDLADDAKENMLIERFTDGLPDEIARELQLHPVPENTLQATINRAEELLLYAKRKQATSLRGKVKTVAALGTERKPPLENWPPHTMPPTAFEPTGLDLGYAETGRAEKRHGSERQGGGDTDRLASALLKLEERLSRLETSAQAGSVNAVSHAGGTSHGTPNTGGARARVCFKCNQPGHIARDCPASAASGQPEGNAPKSDRPPPICFRCNQPGHIARYCRAPAPVAAQADPQAQGDSASTKSQSVRAFDTVCHVRGTISSVVAEGKVGGTEVEFLIDTGAGPSLLPMSLVEDAAKIHGRAQVLGISGTPIDIVGKLSARVELGKWSVVHEFLVTTLDLKGPVLGLDFLMPNNMQVKCIQREPTLVWPKGRIPLVTNVSDNEPLFVALVEDVTLRGDEIAVVRARVIDKKGNPVRPKGVRLVESHARFVENRGVVTARALVDTSDGTVPVQLVGLHGNELVLRKHTRIGELAGIEEVVCAMSATEDKQTDTAPSAPDEMSFRDSFALRPGEVGRTDRVTHTIPTGDAAPIKQAPRRAPHALRSVVENQVEDMLAKGIIRESTSPWASPIVLVRKRDGSFRFCIDYRKVNAVTVKDSFPLPRIDDTFDALGGARIYTTLDLATGK